MSLVSKKNSIATRDRHASFRNARRRRARAATAPEALATARARAVGVARVAVGDSWNRLQNKASS
jgi:hypothetical protein